MYFYRTYSVRMQASFAFAGASLETLQPLGGSTGAGEVNERKQWTGADSPGVEEGDFDGFTKISGARRLEPP